MRTTHRIRSWLPTLAALGWPMGLSAQGTRADSVAVGRLIQAHAEAWNRRDAAAAARVYALGADIRFSSGQRLQTRSAIEAAHRAAFTEDTVGGGSRHGHPSSSLWLRFMHADLALAEVEARYDYRVDSTGRARAPERVLLFLVLTRERGQWSVLAQRNLGQIQ